MTLAALHRHRPEIVAKLIAGEAPEALATVFGIDSALLRHRICNWPELRNWRLARRAALELPEARFTRRDPCFFCGTRGDVPCGHEVPA